MTSPVTDSPAGSPADTDAEADPGTDPARPAGPSLSPSRAADFKTCPLRYRLRCIDRLPEVPTVDMARGTLVHAVLEQLLELPPPQRTRAAAAELVAPLWQRLTGEAEELAALAATFTEAEAAGFLAGTGPLLDGYFTVEDPRRLAPGEREVLVETRVDPAGGDRETSEPSETSEPLWLRGYVDRLDTAPGGELRVVDYKTGGAPREAFEARALFQLKFYALVLWRSRGRVPRLLRLLYLRDAEVCDYTPEPDELARFERTLLALWRAIEAATAAREFRPRPSRLCDWCSFQSLCPEFGGTPPPFPEPPTGPAPAEAPGSERERR